MKKLNAKRFSTTMSYEFLDGREVSITVQTLSTKELEELGEMSKKEGMTSGKINEKSARLLLAKNESVVIDSILKEQFESGVILDFTNALFEGLEEDKKVLGNA